MRQTRILGVVIAVLALAVAASSATAADQANGTKHKGHHVHGKITKLDKDSFTIKVSQHHKKGATEANPPAAPVEKTFKVTAETKFFKAPAEKGGEKQPATFADLKDGEHVAVAAAEGGVAKEVTIHNHHHKKKTAA